MSGLGCRINEGGIEAILVKIDDVIEETEVILVKIDDVIEETEAILVKIDDVTETEAILETIEEDIEAILKTIEAIPLVINSTLSLFFVFTKQHHSNIHIENNKRITQQTTYFFFPLDCFLLFLLLFLKEVSPSLLLLLFHFFYSHQLCSIANIPDSHYAFHSLLQANEHSCRQKHN